MTIPSGWMTADEARKWARRGVWAWQIKPGDAPELRIFDYSPEGVICYGESWRYIGPHPDDAPADVSGLVELEAWVVVSIDPDGANGYVHAHDGEFAANADAAYNRGMGRVSKIVRLTGYTTPPTPEAVETVVGVCHD